MSRTNTFCSEPAKALRLQADLSDVDSHERPVVSSSQDIAEVFYSISTCEREVMIAGSVDARGFLTSWEVVAVGAVDHLIMRVADTFRGALKSGACSVFLVHNHPSGSLEISAEDVELTHTVARAGLFLGIALSDHVIVARDGALSIMHPRNLRLQGCRIVRPQFSTSKTGALSLGWRCHACKAANTSGHLTHIRSVLKGLSTPLQCHACQARVWAARKSPSERPVPAKAGLAC